MEGSPESNGIYLGLLQDGEPPVRLSPDTTAAFFVPAISPGESGHLVFLGETTLMAQACGGPGEPVFRLLQRSVGI